MAFGAPAMTLPTVPQGIGSGRTAVRVTIVGGGISGLATASLLAKALGRAGSVTVLEARPQPGGIITGATLAGMKLDPATDAIAASPDHLAALFLSHGITLPIVRPEGLPQALVTRGDHLCLGDDIAHSVEVVGILGGMWQLPRLLARRLPIRNGVQVQRIERAGALWLARTADGAEFLSEAVVVAVPPGALLRLLGSGLVNATLERFAPRQAVLLAYDQRSVPLRRSTGFLRPPELADRTPVTGCTWLDVKWPASVPRGTRAVARVVLDHSVPGVTDARLRREAHDTIRTLWGVRTDPEDVHISRWPEALPPRRTAANSNVSHPETPPGLEFVGSARGCAGITTCLVDAERAARSALSHLGMHDSLGNSEATSKEEAYA